MDKTKRILPPAPFDSYECFFKNTCVLQTQVRSQISPRYPPSTFICVAMCSISPRHSAFGIHHFFFSFPGHDFDTVTHYCCQIINTSERAPEKKTTKEKSSCEHFPPASAHHSAGETMRKRISHLDAPARIIRLVAPPL